MAVIDPKTKKVANRVFTITDKTKITRAGKAVVIGEVTAQKDEKVAVVVDHDKPGDEAIQMRFEAANSNSPALHRRHSGSYGRSARLLCACCDSTPTAIQRAEHRGKTEIAGGESDLPWHANVKSVVRPRRPCAH